MIMSGQEFVYVIYIASTPEKVWDALTQPEFTEKFWFGARFESSLKPGSRFTMKDSSKVHFIGEILEVDPPRKLIYTFDPHSEALPAETPSRVTCSIEPVRGQVKVTIVHNGFPPDSKVFPSISQGWPAVLSNMKSLLETGLAPHMEGGCSGTK
jgi:uncharacterized protein YndB with AHSA1/START domain